MIGTPIILVCSYELWQRRKWLLPEFAPSSHQPTDIASLVIEGKKPLSLEPKDKTALTDLAPHSVSPESPSTTA